jgi:hypothetical protein
MFGFCSIFWEKFLEGWGLYPWDSSTRVGPMGGPKIYICIP